MSGECSSSSYKAIVWHGMRRAVEAYGVHAVITWVSLLRTPSYRGSATATRLQHALWNTGNVRFGTAVGLYGIIYGSLRKALMELETHWNKHSERLELEEETQKLPTELIPAVAASAVVILIYYARTRRKDRPKAFELNPLRFAVDLLVRSVASYASLQLQLGDPNAIGERFRQYAPIGFFVLGCSEIMYDWFYHPTVLPRLYRRWISSLSHIDDRLLVALRGFKNGTVPYGKHSSVLSDYCRRNEIPTALGDPGRGFIPCQVVHPEHGNRCLQNVVYRWLIGFLSSLKLYFPLQLVGTIFSKGVPLTRNDLLTALSHTTTGASRSSAFLATFIALIWFCVCSIRNTLQDDTTLGVLLACCLCGFSILLERRWRRSELAVYVIPRALISISRRLEIDIMTIQGRCIMGILSSILFIKSFNTELKTVGAETRSRGLSAHARMVLNWLLPHV